MNIPPPDTRAGVRSEFLGLGFEKLDRDLFDPAKAYPFLAGTGVSWIRLQSGWQRTERAKGACTTSRGSTPSSTASSTSVSGTVERLPEGSVERIAPGTFTLRRVPVRDTPLFLLEGTPWENP